MSQAPLYMPRNRSTAFAETLTIKNHNGWHLARSVTWMQEGPCGLAPWFDRTTEYASDPIQPKRQNVTRLITFLRFF